MTHQPAVNGAFSAEQLFTLALERLQSRSAELFGSSQTTFRVELVEDRRFSRIYRLQVQGAAWSGRRIFLKIAKPRNNGPGELEFMGRRIRRDFEIAGALQKAMPQGSGLSVARAIACFPEHLAIVTEEASGITLFQLLERDARRWVAGKHRHGLTVLMRAVGRWLRVFGQSQMVEGSVTVAELRDYLDIRLRRLVETGRVSFDESNRRAILSALARRFDEVEERDLVRVPIHGDFALSNLLVDGTSVTVIDLGMYGAGTRFHDLAHLYMQIGLLANKPSFGGRVVRMLQRSLLDGYDERLTASHPLFELMYLQHTVCHLGGLLSTSGGWLERAYNRRLIGWHLRWLQDFVASSSGHH